MQICYFFCFHTAVRSKSWECGWKMFWYVYALYVHAWEVCCLWVSWPAMLEMSLNSSGNFWWLLILFPSSPSKSFMQVYMAIKQDVILAREDKEKIKLEPWASSYTGSNSGDNTKYGRATSRHINQVKQDKRLNPGLQSPVSRRRWS